MKIKKTNAVRFLDEVRLPYELLWIEVDENDLSAETAALKLKFPLEQVYKTLVARGDKTGGIEACLPAGRELDLKALAAASGNKNVALTAVKELPLLTGYQRGGCSPLGGKKQYPVFILDEALKHDRIVINAGARGLMLLMAPADLIKATGAQPASIAKK